MKPINFRKLLDRPEIRSYTQPFQSPWVVTSGNALAYDANGLDVTSTVIQSVSNTAQSVIFRTKPDVPAGIYTIIVRANMENGDIVDVPGNLTVTTVL